MKCTRCQEELEEMEEYGSFTVEMLMNVDYGQGLIPQIVESTTTLFRCTKPECPNFNLLQGSL